MALTRATARTRTTQRADAVGSSRWSLTAATGEVDQALTHVLDKEWRRLLEHIPSLRLEPVTVTSHASTGRYAIADLSTGSGNDVHRFHRVQAFLVDNIPYTEGHFREFSAGEGLGLSINVFWREGDSVMTLPKQLSKEAIVWVTHLPVQVASLTDETDDITFPDGYEELYIQEAAALLLAKGGAETQATAELKAIAKDIREEMLQDLSRFSAAPVRIRYEDLASDWAG